MKTVETNGLYKIYKLYQSPSHRLKEILFRRTYHTDFIALDNINFTVFKGETFGIIGENGAGKSTLLKILARTLMPTSGSLFVNGRSAALLELGAGFNPELTGEENIYLNAYLMGLSKPEIDRRKQEMIDFSELGDFIKRPVKTYSSGMHVRLAFSIATSVDPEILIVDEALSVGDDYFQKKCIDRMVNFKKAGKTILFCSHSMYHVQELCNRTMWLHHGKVRNIGETGKVVMEYQNYERSKSASLKEDISEIMKEGRDEADKAVRIVDIKVLDRNGVEPDIIRTFEPVTLYFKIKCSAGDVKGHLGFGIIRNDETIIFLAMTNFNDLSPRSLRDGQEFRIKIKSLPLLSGIYSFGAVVADEFALHPYDMLRAKSVQIVHDRKEFGTTYIEHEWEV